VDGWSAEAGAFFRAPLVLPFITPWIRPLRCVRDDSDTEEGGAGEIVCSEGHAS